MAHVNQRPAVCRQMDETCCEKSQATFRMCVNIFQHFVPSLQAFSFPLLTVFFKSFLVIVFKLYYEYHSELNCGTLVTFLNVMS